MTMRGEPWMIVPVDLGWLAFDEGTRHANVDKGSSQLEESYEVMSTKAVGFARD